MSAAAMTTTTDASAKRPYGRPMTEKRKEQNRRSQKVYREKLKKKLEELEERVHEQTQAKPKQSSSSVEEIQEFPGHRSPSPNLTPTTVNNASIIDFNDVFAAAGDLVLPTDNTLPTFELGFRERGRQSQTSTLAPTPAENTIADDSPIPIFLAAEVYMPPDPNSEDMRLMWPMPPHLWTESYTPPSAKERRIPHQSTTFPRSISSTSLSTPSLTFSPFPPTPSSSNSTSGIPSPYLNHLRLLGETAFAASLAIGLALGISRTAYVNDHPSPFSPPPPHLSIPSIPTDLRPTAAQLSLLHPSYLDCIPFPRFRSAAIVLSSRGELNHAALFLDLMHDGLVCWGGAAGGDMRNGAAWSRRSWEARPWFVRRWGWLLAVNVKELGVGLRGGEGVRVREEDDTDGMLEGGRWWRGMRGEEEEEEDESGEGREEHGELLSRHVTCNIGMRDVEEFARNGTLWPTQFGDLMSMKLDSMGLRAKSAMPLDVGGQETTKAE